MNFYYTYKNKKTKIDIDKNGFYIFIDDDVYYISNKNVIFPDFYSRARFAVDRHILIVRNKKIKKIKELI